MMDLARLADAVIIDPAPDAKLAQSSVIVVARWEGTAWEDHCRREGNAVTVRETRTQIVVERVIAGNVQLGKHTVLVRGMIGWSKDVPEIMWYGSSEALGDARADAPNLWFLSRHTWNENDTTEYLSLDEYRGVQPLALTPYFAALRAKQFDAAIPELLRSDDALVAVRTLQQLGGGSLPWPYMEHRVLGRRAGRRSGD